MTTIVTRAGKGSALTWTEGDSNFTNLNTAKLENVVEDLSPQLGGNLDVNGNSIVSTSNTNIVIAPGGTGNIYLTTDTTILGDNNATAILTTQGTGDLVLSTNEGTSSGTITIANGTNGAITIDPDNSGPVILSAPQVQINSTLTTATSANLVLSTNTGTNSGSIGITAGVNGDISLAPNGTGNVNLDADTVLVGDINSLATITTNGTGDLTLNTNAGTNSGSITIANGTNGDITIAPNGTGDLHVITDALRIGDLNTEARISTYGTGNLVLTTNEGNDPDPTITIGNGANANITLTPSGTGKSATTNLTYNEAVYTSGSTTGTITPDAANGPVQSITLTGSITFSAFTTPISGQTLTLIITQPASGGPYTLTSTMKFAGASKTLSTAANAIDILTVSYIGTTYYASLAKGFA